MTENQYVYAVARIRSKEMSLLSGSFLEQLLSAKSLKDCMQLLREKGWGDEGSEPEEMLAGEREKTWNLIRELAGDQRAFDVFLYANDYHNLKAAIKEAKMPYEYPGIYTTKGTVDLKTIKEAVRTREFSLLPESMQGVAREAYDVFMQTGDGQLCDVILDRAALEAVYREASASKNDCIQMYGELTVAAADIKTAVRGERTGKKKEFFLRALAPCKSLDVEELAQAAAQGQEAIESYLNATDYGQAAEELKKSPSAFERWCDNLMIRTIRPQRFNPFGLGPLAAYILARENEIKSVRIVLSGKRSGLPEESIRERVREMYV